ncbi:hypothetical protein TSUD_47880 [Trifolium subterraneum]|nr:hypothetical protein TSUD_47880 [Trifolium subterraneum]
MVVCKCRKATKLYCFVHKVPVCGECICFPEHEICVIRTYSEWVIDGEYDWPPKCCQCQAVLEEGSGSQTTRLGCLHVIHTNCLVSHIKSFPPHTAPAGYVCPSCSTSVPRTIVSVDEFLPWRYGIVDFVPASIGRNTYYIYHVSTTGGNIWPPKSVKDSGSRLHSKLKEAILQTGMEKNIFGNHPVSLSVTESRSPPPAFSSDPLISRENLGNSESVDGPELSRISVSDIVEIDGANSGGNFMKSSSPVAPGATTRKGSLHVDRQNSEVSYYADDEDAKRKKYTKRGPFYHKFLRALLPFWSSALPTLPVTAPARKDGSNAAEASEVRTRHQKSSRMDPRKILLLIAIMYSSFLFLVKWGATGACMATMGILYYRLVQRGPGDELLNNDE